MSGKRGGVWALRKNWAGRPTWVEWGGRMSRWAAGVARSQGRAERLLPLMAAAGALTPRALDRG